MLSHFDEIFRPSAENLSSSDPFPLYDLFKGNDDGNESNDNRSGGGTFVQRLVDGILELGNLWQRMNPIHRLTKTTNEF